MSDAADDSPALPSASEPTAAPGVTRRRVMDAAAVIGGFAILGRATPLAAAPAISDRSWKQLSRKVSGEVLRPDDAGFKATARPNNLVYDDRLPLGIARCRTPEDVAAAVLWCRENNVRFATRAGGYNYAGFSTTRGLLIDVAELNAVSFDKQTGRVRVGGGATHRDLFAALSRREASIVHGRVLGIGVGGFTLGGGLGYDARLHGVGSDRLAATDIVCADGEIRTAGAKSEQDLFWACRGGGGGNFGINVEFAFETFAVEDVTTFDITWSSKPEAVAAALLKALAEAPDRCGSKTRLRSVPSEKAEGGRTIEVRLTGQLHGPREELLDILAPVFAVAPAERRTLRHGPYWDCQKLVAEERKPDRYRGRSRFVAKDFDAAALDAAFRQVRRFPGTKGDASLKLLQTGAALNAPAPDDTAFVHRDSAWLLMTTFSFKPSDSRRTVAAAGDWLDETYEEMLPHCGKGAFQNMSDPALKDWAKQYYGDNLDRLRRIKAAVDPTELFRHAQSIAPAK